MIRLEPEDSITLKTLLEVLTLFFLRTSLWMRIDRLDGVGDLFWAGEAAVSPIWAGFGEGLKKMARIHGFPPAFVGGVKQYLASHTVDNLMDLGLQIVARYSQTLPEVPLIKRHLKAHVEKLFRIMQETP